MDAILVTVATRKGCQAAHDPVEHDVGNATRPPVSLIAAITHSIISADQITRT